MQTYFNRATTWLSTREGLATAAGGILLAATTNANIMHYCGWATANAGVVAGMGFAVFAGARALGSDPKGFGRIGAVLIAGMIAGETFNFISTGELTISERDEKAAPIRAAAARHTAAVERLEALEAGTYESPRLKLARDAIAGLETETESSRVAKARTDLKAARDAWAAEARNGCKTQCLIKKDTVAATERELDAALAAQRADREKAIADARSELRAAASASEAQRQASIESAKADVAKNPVPEDDAPLAKRIGVSAWLIDLIAAALRSIGSNVLSAGLIALGARRRPDGEISRTETDGSGNSAEKPESPVAANDANPGNPGPDSPTTPTGPKSGKRGRRRSAEVLKFSDAFRERHGRTPNGPEIKAEFPGMGRTTAYDYAARVRVSS